MNYEIVTRNLEVVTARKSRHAVRLPGEPGIWAFIFGDMLVFSLLFSVFMYYRGDELPLFRETQKLLSQNFGLLNTAIMLSSSLFVALAVDAARKGRKTAPTAFYILAIACGLGFIASKFFEYSSEIHKGASLISNNFFMYYFMLTGIHLIHVVIGTGVLGFLAIYSRGLAGSFSETDIRNIESGSCFWHVIDLLWIVLFALLYLVS